MADASYLVEKLTELNPFTPKETHEHDYEDFGEQIDEDTVAGGGRGYRRSEITKGQLRVSHALKSFLVNQNVLSAEEIDLDSDDTTDALQALLDRPHINVPDYVNDRSYPLSDYFISSSHNTYLVAAQLTGKASPAGYRRALTTGSRCVEIDAWDNSDDKDEPKVTHGYTLVTHIPFRSVCETIRDVVDQEASVARDEPGYRTSPVFISLENHCTAHGQLRMVEIMKEVWGDRLLSKPVRQKAHLEQEGQGDPVTLEDLGNKILLIVEYHFGEEVEYKDGEPVTSTETDDKEKIPKNAIIPELAELGVYAQSVKPVDNSWFEDAELKNGPPHHLINVSETQLAAHLPANDKKISIHNSRYMMRVFPKGTRIESTNMKPVPFWGTGAQICALNWQHFGVSLQLNEALFSGTDGYVLKPPALRSGGSGKPDAGKKLRLFLHVAGATNVPVAPGREADSIKPYLTCTLVHPDNIGDDFPKSKTEPYKQHRLGFFHRGENPPPTDPVWDQTLEWEYEENDLAFLRFMIKSDDSFAVNPILAVSAVRLLYASSEWNFIRMLDLQGRETTCALLVKFGFYEL
ncbi:putative 1-phosphatidylinositol-4,5-bisphosphate phosphodiesterase 1 [Xylariales sp. PMI_506]|nr:putative 1-phosphatidylinositol-4,5-bisphosphate phosphodiesterase 1 [Xylariales sp. PMI_506]